MAKAKQSGEVEELVFKHEDEADGMIMGPLWKRVPGGQLVNYENSGSVNFNGEPNPRWYSLRQARRLAKALGVECKEV